MGSTILFWGCRSPSLLLPHALANQLGFRRNQRPFWMILVKTRTIDRLLVGSHWRSASRTASVALVWPARADACRSS
jgi:hypothetical protein